MPPWDVFDTSPQYFSPAVLKNMFVLVGLLLTLSVSIHAETKLNAGDTIVDNFMEMDKMEHVYLPANKIDQRGRMFYNQNPRFYPIAETKFGIMFNPLRCFPQGHNDEHRVILSFMEDWRVDMKIKPEHMLQNAFVIQRNVEYSMYSNEKQKQQPLHSWEYYYTISRYINGSMYPGQIHGMKMDILNLEISVKIGKNQSIMAFVNGRDEIKGLKNTLYFPVPLPRSKNTRYIALFASEQDACPAFISRVDANFKVWTPERKLHNVKGIPVEPPGQTTVLRDIFIAACACTVYCWALVNYVIPKILTIVIPDKKTSTKKKE